jgi:hypothetical protein
MMQTFRLIRAKAARSKIRIPLVWYWHLGLRHQDVFQASYPRSGSTWLRFMLFQILRGEEAGFGKIDACIPEIEHQRGIPPVLPMGGRLIKTHEKYRKDYSRAVFLVRDVRDVFLSTYASAVDLGTAPFVSKGDLDSFLVSFLEGRALQMGSWQEHSRSWLESPLAERGNLMVVKYEDLRRNPEPMLARLLEFLGVNPNLETIRKAVESNSLQQMRAKEDQARKAGERSVLLASYKGSTENGRFVRKGSVGGWRSKLTEAQVKLIDDYCGETLAALGYETGAAEAKPSESTLSALSY